MTVIRGNNNAAKRVNMTRNERYKPLIQNRSAQTTPKTQSKMSKQEDAGGGVHTKTTANNNGINETPHSPNQTHQIPSPFKRHHTSSPCTVKP